MIAIVSTAPRERAAFAALCATRGVPTLECHSAAAFARLLGRVSPRVVLVRHKLADGYSDDVIAALGAAGLLGRTRVIVLIGAGSPPALEARQVTLGADCVQRDPVRTDVLAAYLEKYYAAAAARGTRREATVMLRFAGAVLNLPERRLRLGDKVAELTPRETELARVLAQSPGAVITYETLYSEILGRKFEGDTSNMRVLLGKLSSSAATIGVAVRRWIEVIPKSGYRYRRTPANPLRLPPLGKKLLSAA